MIRKSAILTIVFISILGIPQKAFSQVLHSENFNVIIDMSKTIKGNFTPGFRFRNIKSDFPELENTADLSVRIKNHAFTVANKIEYSIFGDENIMSGGYLYLEYVNTQSKILAFEPFFRHHLKLQISS